MNIEEIIGKHKRKRKDIDVKEQSTLDRYMDDKDEFIEKVKVSYPHSIKNYSK